MVTRWSKPVLEWKVQLLCPHCPQMPWAWWVGLSAHLLLQEGCLRGWWSHFGWSRGRTALQIPRRSSQKLLQPIHSIQPPAPLECRSASSNSRFFFQLSPTCLEVPVEIVRCCGTLFVIWGSDEHSSLVHLLEWFEKCSYPLQASHRSTWATGSFHFQCIGTSCLAQVKAWTSWVGLGVEPVAVQTPQAHHTHQWCPQVSSSCTAKIGPFAFAASVLHEGPLFQWQRAGRAQVCLSGGDVRYPEILPVWTLSQPSLALGIPFPDLQTCTPQPVQFPLTLVEKILWARIHHSPLVALLLQVLCKHWPGFGPKQLLGQPWLGWK